MRVHSLIRTITLLFSVTAFIALLDSSASAETFQVDGHHIKGCLRALLHAYEDAAAACGGGMFEICSSEQGNINIYGVNVCEMNLTVCCLGESSPLCCGGGFEF